MVQRSAAHEPSGAPRHGYGTAAARASIRRAPGSGPIGPAAVGHLLDEGRQLERPVALIEAGAAFGDARTLLRLQQALDPVAEPIDLAHAHAGTHPLVLGEAGTRQLI